MGWYYIEPLDASWIVVGGIPPVIANTMRDPGAPTSSDDVTVSAEITDDTGVDQSSVFMHYKMGLEGGTFTDVLMTTANDTLFEAVIPAQPEGSVIAYFVSAMDDSGGVSVDPDTSAGLYFYYVKDEALTPYEVQYTRPGARAPPAFNTTASLTSSVPLLLLSCNRIGVPST